MGSNDCDLKQLSIDEITLRNAPMDVRFANGISQPSAEMTACSPSTRLLPVSLKSLVPFSKPLGLVWYSLVSSHSATSFGKVETETSRIRASVFASRTDWVRRHQSDAPKSL